MPEIHDCLFAFRLNLGLCEIGILGALACLRVCVCVCVCLVGSGSGSGYLGIWVLDKVR